MVYDDRRPARKRESESRSIEVLAVVVVVSIFIPAFCRSSPDRYLNKVGEGFNTKAFGRRVEINSLHSSEPLLLTFLYANYRRKCGAANLEGSEGPGRPAHARPRQTSGVQQPGCASGGCAGAGIIRGHRRIEL